MDHHEGSAQGRRRALPDSQGTGIGSEETEAAARVSNRTRALHRSRSVDGRPQRLRSALRRYRSAFISGTNSLDADRDAQGHYTFQRRSDPGIERGIRRR